MIIIGYVEFFNIKNHIINYLQCNKHSIHNKVYVYLKFYESAWFAKNESIKKKITSQFNN